jgi:hypothetical protein
VIRIAEQDGRRFLETVSEQPMIYLDHWALRLFSSNSDLRHRFFEAFARRGTLLFSVMNISEIAANTGGSADEIRSFLAQVGPCWAAITVNPAKVAEDEDRLDPPEGDRSVAFGYAMMTEPGFLAKLAATSDLSLAHVVDMTRGEDGDKTRAATSESARDMLAQIEKFRAAHAKNPAGLNLSYPPIAWNPRRPMRYVYHGLMRSVVKDGFKLNENHVRDFLHTAVATTVAQMLLLDPHWAEMVRKLKLPETYTHVYTKDEVERFLSDLASLPAIR